MTTMRVFDQADERHFPEILPGDLGPFERSAHQPGYQEINAWMAAARNHSGLCDKPKCDCYTRPSCQCPT